MNILAVINFIGLLALGVYVMVSQAEHAAALAALKDQVVKTRAETLEKIAKLEEAVANSGNTSPEVDEALAALKTAVQAADDDIPDAVPA
jgi:hypothetical protein